MPTKHQIARCIASHVMYRVIIGMKQVWEVVNPPALMVYLKGPLQGLVESLATAIPLEVVGRGVALTTPGYLAQLPDHC